MACEGSQISNLQSHRCPLSTEMSLYSFSYLCHAVVGEMCDPLQSFSQERCFLARPLWMPDNDCDVLFEKHNLLNLFVSPKLTPSQVFFWHVGQTTKLSWDHSACKEIKVEVNARITVCVFSLHFLYCPYFLCLEL